MRHLYDQRARHRQQGSPLAVVQSQGRLPQAGKRYERALTMVFTQLVVSVLVALLWLVVFLLRRVTTVCILVHCLFFFRYKLVRVVEYC